MSEKDLSMFGLSYNKDMYKSWSQSGFSILQGLLLSAVLAGGALVGTQLITSQKDQMKATETIDAVEQVHTLIYSVLQNTDHCFTSLTMNTGVVINPPLPRKVPFNNIKLKGSSSTEIAFQVNQSYLNNLVRISTMDITLPADLTNNATLDIMYQRNEGTKKGYGGEFIKRNISIALKRSAPNTISGCFSVTMDQGAIAGNEDLTEEICLSMGIMVWDPVFRTCKPKDNICPASETFAGLDADSNKICVPFISHLPAFIGAPLPTDQSDDCPADFDTIRFAVDRNGKIFPECNKAGSSCPSESKKNWAVTTSKATSACEGYIGRGLNGEIKESKDELAPSFGDAKFRCQNGTWIEVGSSAKCKSDCSGTALNWRNGSAICYGSVAYSENGTVENLIDTTKTAGDLATGDAVFKCENGRWNQKSGSCNSECIPLNQNWTVGSETCSGLATSPGGLPTAHNVAVSVTNSAATVAGAATYRCNNGGWTKLSSPSPTCVTTVKGGTCSWSTEISWSHNSCLGFQTAPVSKPGNMWTKTAALCNDVCDSKKTCAGKKSNGDCSWSALP